MDADADLRILRDKMAKNEPFSLAEVSQIISLIFREMEQHTELSPLASAISKFALNRPLTINELAAWWGVSKLTVFRAADSKLHEYNRLKTFRLHRNRMVKPSRVREYEDRKPKTR